MEVETSREERRVEAGPTDNHRDRAPVSKTVPFASVGTAPS